MIFKKAGFLLGAGFFLFCSNLHAYDGKLFSLALGAKASTGTVVRGARTYDGLQLSPVFYLGFFDERVQIFGTSLELNDFIWSDKLRARTKIGLLSDKPFLKFDGPTDIRASRPSSLEWTSRLELFLPSFEQTWFQLDLVFAHELKEHKGNYVELVGKLTLARLWLEKKLPLVEPQLFMAVGYGDKAHNSLWYGRPSGGSTHAEYGFSVVSPARIDRHYPIFRFYRYDVWGNPPTGPGLLLGHRSGYQLEAQIAFGIF